MKFSDYLPTIKWRRVTRKEELTMKLDRFKKWNGLFINFPNGKSWCVFTRKVTDTNPPTNPPLAPA